MRPTPLNRAIVAAAGGLLLAGFLSVSIAPSLAGLAALAFALHSRFSAAAAFRATVLRIERRVLEPVLHEGAPFHVEIDARGSRVAAGVAFEATDRVPAGIEALEPATVSGLAVARYGARATAKGSALFSEISARLTDARGLWVEHRALKVATSVQVIASKDALEAGRRLARRSPIEATAKSPVGLIVRDLEFESIRNFAPGDRLRDVDWKRYARLGKLLTKTWEKELEATVIFLVDAGRTMRARVGEGVTKLDHAANLVLELAEAATERNYRVGFIVFDDVLVVDEARPTRDRSFPRRLSQRLSALPARILAERRLDVGLPGDARADEDEVSFLAAIATARGAVLSRASRAKPRMGIEAAIDRLARDASSEKLFIIAFTDGEGLPDRTFSSLARLSAGGHRVISVLLPGTRFFAPPRDPRARDLEAAYRETEVRRRARAALTRSGSAIVEVGPEDTAARVVAAADEKRASRSSGRGA